jgi:hypothetical protein
MLMAFIMFQLSGCGTLFYPERRGQRPGRIDAGVAVLDGLGLLLYVVPGVIAFAIDFGTGAIYLPGSPRTSLDPETMKTVKFDAGSSSDERLEKIIGRETGVDVRLSDPEMRTVELGSVAEIKEKLELAEKDGAGKKGR